MTAQDRAGGSGRQGPAGEAQGEQEAGGDDAHQGEAEGQFLAVAPGFHRGGEHLGGAEGGHQQADGGDRQAHDPGGHQGHRVGPGDEAGDPQAVDAVGDEHAQHEQQGEAQGVLPAAVAGGGEGEEGGLGQGVEGEGEEGADGGHQQGVAGFGETAEETALDAGGAHHLARSGGQHGPQVHGAEQGEEGDGDEAAHPFEPFGHLPHVGQGADRQGDGDDDGAVAERKEGAAVARQARVAPAVEAGEAVDGGQVVGVEAVLHAQDQHQGSEGEPVVGQGIHGP